MFILTAILTLAASAAGAAPYPSVTFIGETPGPDKLEKMQKLVTESDLGRCSVFFEFLPRSANLDVAAKARTMKLLCRSKTKFKNVFGLEHEALKILEATNALLIALRYENQRDVGSVVNLGYALTEMNLRFMIKKQPMLQPWRKLLDSPHATTAFKFMEKMTTDDLRNFLLELRSVLIAVVENDGVAYFDVDLETFPKSGLGSADVDAYFAKALPIRNAYMATSIVTCERALVRPLKVNVFRAHIPPLRAELEKAWPGAEFEVIDSK